MTDLFWPGDERAGDLLSQESFLAAMVRVEAAWLRALVDAQVAPPSTYDDLSGLVSPGDVAIIAASAEGGGNPVIPLVAVLRERLHERDPAVAGWLHRGLTSQDVVDTALVLGLQDAARRMEAEIARQVTALVALAEGHRGSLMAGRTLTQQAVPITFGLKAAMWLQGLLDAADGLAAAAQLPSQVGGAAGTMAESADGDPQRAVDVAARLSEALGLATGPPWHTNRGPITRFADALVGCTDAYGRIANDVLTLSRPEIAELSEPAAPGRGASSAMPHKVNPVLSVLIRRAALTGPALGAQLHLAAAEMLDERADGSWHTEWATLATLARRAVVAASQTSELLEGVSVRDEQMRSTLEGAGAGTDLGATDLIIDTVLERARRFEEPQ